jgi:SPP1 gp7 family putative phage head morphogenesis protein
VIRRSPWPRHLERQLAARLRRRARVVRTIVLEQIRASARHDADSVFGGHYSARGPRIRLAVRQAQPIPASSLVPTARGIDATVTGAVVRDLEAQLPGAELAPVVAARPTATREAIRAWTEETATRVAESEDAMVDRALKAADGADDPEKAARDALASAEDRAALLARDAVGDLVSEVTRIRAGQLGSGSYTWRSQGDGHVRPLHQQLTGTERRWDDPHPTEGHPGDAYGCRCWAEPIAGLESPRKGRLPPVGPPPPLVLPALPTPPAPPAGRLPPEVEVEVRTAEDRIRREPEENGAIVLPDGSVIELDPEYTRDNGRDPAGTLGLPRAALDAARANRGAVLTHNHPDGSIFSPRDLQMASHLDLAEVRAVKPDGGAWVVRRPAAGWPAPDRVFASVTEAKLEGVKHAWTQMDTLILAAGGDPRDGENATGWDPATWDRIHAHHVESGIRDGIRQAGLTLEFEP